MRLLRGVLGKNTSHKKGYPFEVACDFSKIDRVILADHIRSVDWKARHAKLVDVVPACIVEEVKERLLSLIEA